jgi:ABC-type nitrate/sulfonate/bicarbonate transport system permease component
MSLMTGSATLAWTDRAGRLATSAAFARLVLLAAFLLFWEFGAAWWGDRAMVRPLSEVVQALFNRVLSDPKILAAIRVTFLELSLAYGLAILVGLGIGLTIGMSRWAEAGAFPLVVMLYGVPQVVLLPLFILVFGLGPASKIAFGFSHGVFPIIFNVVAGMRNVNQLYLRSARSMGATPLEVFRHVTFPHMVPSFFAGLRLAMTMTLLGILLAELYVSSAGIGYYTQVFSETFNPAPLFALIAVLAGMAILLNELVRIAERRFTRWKD